MVQDSSKVSASFFPAPIGTVPVRSRLHNLRHVVRVIASWIEGCAGIVVHGGQPDAEDQVGLSARSLSAYQAPEGEIVWSKRL
jgi:hypothetical protein